MAVLYNPRICIRPTRRYRMIPLADGTFRYSPRDLVAYLEGDFAAWCERMRARAASSPLERLLVRADAGDRALEHHRRVPGGEVLSPPPRRLHVSLPVASPEPVQRPPSRMGSRKSR